MNPTTPPQPPALSLLTAYLGTSTTGKKWRLAGVRPVDEGHHTVPRSGRPVAVGRRHSKRNPRLIVPAHCGTKGRQADGTARARTPRKGRPGASPLSLRDERDARCKRIPRPNGRATRHTPHGADGSRTNPVLPTRTPSSGRKLPAGTRDRPAVPRWNPRPSGWGGCQSREYVRSTYVVHWVTAGSCSYCYSLTGRSVVSDRRGRSVRR